ncbi:hypothetical protein [Polaromonas hydrogenivorans]|uniref:Uncharacterized protein n=1 Tax=Polaromonas hydrogenivorans TaxID=335476 RepID=A0AAU7LRE5_9BURK
MTRVQNRRILQDERVDGHANNAIAPICVNTWRALDVRSRRARFAPEAGLGLSIDEDCKT